MLSNEGMPVFKDGSLYNCRVLLLNKKIIAIRPKTRLANNGNYRESRWFTPWTNANEVTCFHLPPIICRVTGQEMVPFGSSLVLEIPFPDTGSYGMFLGNSNPFRIGFEICEELWQPEAIHISLYGRFGCHLVCNSSGSYWEIRKLNRTLALIESATSKCGGFYAYSNLIGCDGTRLCFYGRSLVAGNGRLICQTTTEQTLFSEVEVAVTFLDPNDISAYRHQNNIKVNQQSAISRIISFDAERGFNQLQEFSSLNQLVISIKNFELLKTSNPSPTPPVTELKLCPEKEIFYFGSLWLWDYLRRSRFAKGFIIPLSGGLDSSSVALLIASLCDLLAVQVNLPEIAGEMQRICPLDNLELGRKQLARMICSKLLRCVYLKTKFSGQASQDRAEQLAKLIGAEFAALDFTDVYEKVGQLGNSVLTENLSARTKTSDDQTVNILQQNLQARIRMLFTYYLSDGDRLVLATGNVDEALVGYLTKYDCSSADLNPIGSIAKEDLRRFIEYVEKVLFNGLSLVIRTVLDATPSAELSGEEQKDEDEIGLTYKELSLFGSLRKGDLGCYGPYGMFCKLWMEHTNPHFADGRTLIDQDPYVLAAKVKRFFTLHARNRHKQTVLTPALHAVTYSPDDNRFDHRQFLYNADWNWQFKCIDETVCLIRKKNEAF